jgi:hypothetical protein
MLAVRQQPLAYATCSARVASCRAGITGGSLQELPHTMLDGVGSLLVAFYDLQYYTAMGVVSTSI